MTYFPNLSYTSTSKIPTLQERIKGTEKASPIHTHRSQGGLHNSHSHSANVFRVDDPRSEPRVLHELTQNKMVEDAESDIAIRFVDENDYREISAKDVSAKRKLKKQYSRGILNTLNILSGLLRIIYNSQFEERNFWFNIYSFISLLLFNKNDTWRPTCFIVQTTAFNRPAKFLILLKH